MNLEETLRQRELAAGGPGSGRKPYATATMMDVLSHHGFEKTGNTKSGNSVYRNDSGDAVVADHKQGLWMHKEKHSGFTKGGSGLANLDHHLARNYGNDKFSDAEVETRLNKRTAVYASDDTEEIVGMGIANDSFHWGIMDVMPPKDTVPVENPGDDIDKLRRMNKDFLEYEKQLQMNQGHGKIMVTTQQVDNSDVMDLDRSNWFV